jgi:cupin fold WbuC family metalloprotein
MKIFDINYLNTLTSEAQVNLRKRQCRNIHESYKDPCQRLFNAIELGSYIRPHRHATDPREELLIAVRGSMALVTFNEQGMVTNIVRFGADRSNKDLAAGVEVPANIWHSVIALEPGCVLFEAKAGPFDPSQPKDLAPWAPDEDGPNVQQYLKKLISKINNPED